MGSIMGQDILKQRTKNIRLKIKAQAVAFGLLT